MRMPWEDDINWGNIATTFGKENDMVTTDKVTVAEFAPHIGKTTTDYKENDMVADKIEIKIEPKLVIPRETADLCARILEAWLLSDDTANIEIINNGCEKEIYLTSMR